MAFNNLIRLLNQPTSPQNPPLASLTYDTPRFSSQGDGKIKLSIYPATGRFGLGIPPITTDEQWADFRNGLNDGTDGGNSQARLFIDLTTTDTEGQIIANPTGDPRGTEYMLWNDDKVAFIISAGTFTGSSSYDLERAYVSFTSPGFMLAQDEGVMFRIATPDEIAERSPITGPTLIQTAWAQLVADNSIETELLISGQEVQQVTVTYRVKYASLQGIGNNAQIQQALTGEVMEVDGVPYGITGVAFIGRRDFIDITANLLVAGS